MVGAIADLLESPDVDLRARGFRRVTSALSPLSHQAWDRRVSDDIIWRISIDGDRWSKIHASVIVKFLAGCRPFAPFYVPFNDCNSLLSEDVTDVLGGFMFFHPGFNIDRPRRRRRPEIPQTATEQLTWLLDEQAMPWFEKFRDLQSVLAEMVARRTRDDTGIHYFTFCEAALLRWRLGDLEGAMSDLVAAAASIEREVVRIRSIWPPKAWFGSSPEAAPRRQKSCDEVYAYQNNFVRQVKHFVEHQDPSRPVVPTPLWPGLDDVGRTWRAGTWRRRWLKPPWKVPTLYVLAHDEDVVGILYGPTEAGQSEAWLGPGPAYFDDDAVYDVSKAVAGVRAWALESTGVEVDPEALCSLIAPADDVDLLDALTTFCAMLGLGLPKA